MERQLFVYDSFTDEVFKGNPAGVVIFADGMTNEEMMNISNELGYSETAFIMKGEKAEYKVRFFTPSEEVDLCGHATIAYVTCLVDERYITLKTGENILEIETNLGVLPIYITASDDCKIAEIMMLQDTPEFRTIDKQVNPEELMLPLGLTKEELSETIPVIAAYTGLWDIMVPLKSQETLSKIKLNKEEMMKVSKKTDTISYHAYVVEKVGSEPRIHARNFAPIVAIDEEAATGTSNAAMGAFLVKLGVLDENQVYYVEQGKAMKRESNIYFKIKEKEGELLPYVGGRAVRFLKGVL